MADTSPTVGAAEAVEATDGISRSFIEELRTLLLDIVRAYNIFYYEKEPVYKGDGLISGITFFKDEIKVSGLYCSEAGCSIGHKFKDGGWVFESYSSQIPLGNIPDLLKSLQEAVRGQVDGRVVFDTPDDGLEWYITIYKEGTSTTYDLGSIGADDLYFHTCPKVDF